MRFFAGLLTALVILCVGVVGVVFSGIYNVAATEPHSSLVRWLFSTTMHRSIEMHASKIEPPAVSDDQVQSGIAEFDEMCVTCHGAPGKKPTAIGKGLRPTAPDLAKAAQHWDAHHLFWIIKNGIKMTAMPAFGVTHSDEEIWNIVAFVRGLPEMTPKEYEQLVKTATPKSTDRSH